MSDPERFRSIPKITDHALLRFMERVKGINIDVYRAELGQFLYSIPEWDVQPKPSHEEGLLLVKEYGRLVTILPKGMRGKKRNKHAKYATIF